VQIDYQDQVLTVRGARACDHCCPERYQQLERGQGPFSRSFRFALPVQDQAISADLADGVLTIVVPKRLDRHDIPVE
jgi:HSP20 family molecular chaperone IbpA